MSKVVLLAFLYHQAQCIAAKVDRYPSPESGEPFELFCVRRHSASSAIAKKMGLWSHEWAQSVVNWFEHVARGGMTDQHGPNIFLSGMGQSGLTGKDCSGQGLAALSQIRDAVQVLQQNAGWMAFSPRRVY